MAKRNAIPAIPLGAENADVLQALKNSVENLTGQTSTKITKLGTTASTADIIVKINQIIDRLQT